MFFLLKRTFCLCHLLRASSPEKKKTGQEGINATSLLEATDNYGYTPMHTAVTACHRQDGIVRALRDSYRSSHNEEEWPLDPKLGFCLCDVARENDQVFLNALRISGCTLAHGFQDGQGYLWETQSGKADDAEQHTVAGTTNGGSRWTTHTTTRRSVCCPSTRGWRTTHSVPPQAR